MPRLTIVSQWYPPEQAPFGRMMQELATRLAGAGWEVTVITGFPNHPTGVVQDGFTKQWVQEERAQRGVRLLRVWLATAARRCSNNLSFQRSVPLRGMAIFGKQERAFLAPRGRAPQERSGEGQLLLLFQQAHRSM